MGGMSSQSSGGCVRHKIDVHPSEEGFLALNEMVYKVDDEAWVVMVQGKEIVDSPD